MATDNIKDLQAQLELLKKLIKAEKDLAKQKELTAQAGSLERVIQRLQKYDDSLDNIQRRQEEIVDGANSIGQAVGNLPLGNYLKFQTVSQDISKELAEVQANIDKVSREINQDFAKQKLAIPKPNSKAFKSVISELEMQQAGLGKDLQEALMSGDIATFYKKYGEEGRRLAKEAMDKKKGFVGVATYFGKDGQGPKDLKTFQEGMRKIQEEAKEFQKITLDTGALWRGIRQNILQNFGFGKIIEQVKDFDNKLANLKKEFQIPVGNFKMASEAMADLTIKGAKFGLTQQESFQLVKDIGEEMRSTNVKNLSAIAQSVAAIPAAMGIASSEVGKITGQMMFFGMHADRVQTAFKAISKQSAVFGQNSTRVAKQFGEAYPKFKMMGMKGTEGAIAAMAAQAEKLGINLASSVNSSKDFLDIGEAMEASADLSLLGGAAAQVSYADLMMARLDPKKMIDIQDKITAGLGKFNKATGEVDFGYSDLVQMQQMAQRLGVDYEVLYKRAKGQREDAAKASMFDSSMFKNLKPEEKAFLLSKVVSKGGGKFAIEGMEGVTDLKKVSQGQIKAMMEGSVNEKKNAEQLAKERASFEETVSRMKGTIMALFNRFQPILQMLTNVLGKVIDVAQSFSNAITRIFGDTVGKYVKASIALGAVLMLTLGPGAIARFSGMLFRGLSSPLKALSGFGAKMTGAFKGAGGKTVSTLAEKAGGAMPDIGGKMKGGKTPPTFLQQFAKVNPASILATAAALLALGAALMMVGKGIQLAATGFATLVRAFNETKNAGMALAAIAVVMGGFVAMLYLMIGAVAGLAAAGTAGAVGLLALGASLLMIGGAVYLAAKGLSILVSSMMMMGRSIGAAVKGAVGLVALAGALVLISPALVIFGAASLIAVPGMFALGYLLKGLGATKGVNPGIIKAVANSMGSMAWGLFKLGAAAVVAPLAIISAMALNYVASSIKNLGAVDPKKIIGFGVTLSIFANSVSKGLAKLGLLGLAAPLALVAAFSINRISKLLNDIKPINSKNMKAFGASLGSIGLKVAWGLTKLALISLPALAAIPGAMTLNLISRLLNGIKPVSEKNMAAFAKSLTYVGLRVIVGLMALTAASIYGVTALPGAIMINLISKLLNGVKPVDQKNMAAFGASLKTIGLSVAWGFAKLSVIGVTGVGALLGATTINLISKLLNGVKPVDQKNIAAFGASLGKIGGNVLFGMAKLALISIPALLAAVAANRMVAISKSLNSIIPIDKDKITSFANAMGKVSGKMVWGVTKLGVIAVPAILATTAANRMVQISKALNSIVPINFVKIFLFGLAMGQISGRMVWGMTKLAAISLPAVPATSAANRLVTISKLLNSIVPVNVQNIANFGKSLGSIGLKVVWGIGKLAAIAIPAMAANSAASRLASISKSLNGIAPVNLSKIKQLAIAMKSVGGWAITKLGALSIPARGALSTARSLFQISLFMGLVRPVGTGNIAMLTKAMDSLGKWILTKFGAMAMPAKGALSTATSLMNLSKNLNAIVPVNFAKILFLNMAMKVISGKMKDDIKKLAGLSSFASKARSVAFSLFNISLFLSLIRTPNVPAIIAFGNSLGHISGKVIKGVKRLAGILEPVQLASKSSAYMLAISRNLSQVKSPNIPAIVDFGNALTKISGKVIWGVTKLGLLYAPLSLANKSAKLMASTSQSLSMVKEPNVANMIKFGASLVIISGKVMWGVTKLGLLYAPLLLANRAAALMVSTSRFLTMVKEPNVGAMAKFGASLSIISGKVMWGVTKLGLLVGPLLLANKSAQYLASTSNYLSQVKAPNLLGIALFGASLGQLTKKLMWGVLKLGLLVVPLTLASISASLIVKISSTLVNNAKTLISLARILNQIPIINIKRLLSMAQVLGASMPRVAFGIMLLARINPLIPPAKLATRGLKHVAYRIKAIPQVFFLGLFSLGRVLSSQMPRVLAGVKMLSKVVPYILSSMVSATGLRLIANRIKTIPQVFFIGLFSIGRVLFTQMPRVITGLKRLIKVIPFIPSAARAARGLATISRILRTISPINLKAVLDLGRAVNEGGSLFTKGILKWFFLSLFMGRAVRTIANVSKIFTSLNSIGAVNVPKIIAVIPVLDKLAIPLLQFANLGTQAPKMILASNGIRALGRSLGVSSIGFNAFAKVPWGSMGMASKQLAQVVNSLNSVANKTSISPNLSKLAKTLYVLATAMRVLTTGFTGSAKAMAQFNSQSDKLKIKTGKPETAKVGAVTAVTKGGPTAGAGVRPVAGAVGPGAPATAQTVRIAPIEINLKLNGMQIQKLIAEANFYRT